MSLHKFLFGHAPPAPGKLSGMAYPRPEPPNGRNGDPMIAALRRFLAATDAALRAAERVRLARAELGRLLADAARTQGGD